MHVRRTLRFGLMLAAASLLPSVASASVITFLTPQGSTTSGGAVNASATFTTSAGALTIELNNLLADPGNVAQLLSDLEFMLSDGASGASLTSSSGTEITVNADGTATPGGTVSTGWSLASTGGNGLVLDVLGTPVGPSHLIIGPGPYTNANGSIAGNRPHNPFLLASTTFNIAAPAITAATTVTSAIFSFGTTAGINVAGTPGQPDVPVVPEPSVLALLGLGLAALGLARRKSRYEFIRTRRRT